MKLLSDEEFKACLLDPAKVKYKVEDTVTLSGWNYEREGNCYYFTQKSENSSLFFILEMEEEEVWELDEIQSAVFLKRQSVRITEGHAEFCENGELFVYIRRKPDEKIPVIETKEKIFSLKEQIFQLNKCDLYLLVPGKWEGNHENWEELSDYQNDLFDIFKKDIDDCIEEEYSNDFVKSIDRKCINAVTLEVVSLSSKEIYRQTALTGIIKHKTGFCILEIMMLNVLVGGTKILDSYCGERINILYNGASYSIPDYLKNLGITPFGKRRSMVFAYGDVSERELVNALANEEFPMGRIGGDFEKLVKEKNIAQYDTARVYVSSETMIEHCSFCDVNVRNRISYQVIELFFVELLLFQDASIDRIFRNLKKEMERQLEGNNPDLSMERLEQISYELSETMQFSDYSQFQYPTVRESAKKVAEGFGIELVMEQYESNRSMIETMIHANERRATARQEKIKNKFLLLISALALVGTLGEMIYTVFDDKRTGVISYFLSVAFVVSGWGIYVLWLFISKKPGKKKGEG